MVDSGDIAGNMTDMVHAVPESLPQISVNLAVICSFLFLDGMIAEYHQSFEFWFQDPKFPKHFFKSKSNPLSYLQ